MRRAFLLLVTTVALAASFPQDKLPAYITRVTDYGERAEWSLDGSRIMYLTRAGGDVYELDLETGQTKPISLHYRRPREWGYYRALYLSNGDYLLTGGPSRQEAYLHVLSKELNKPPKIFKNIVVAEGPAVSRTSLRIAWTEKQEKVWVADLVYRSGDPRVANGKLLLDNRNIVVDGVKFEGMIEPQDFRPPDERELIWAQYGNTEDGLFTSEVMGIDLETGELTNYSRSPGQYDEPEGIFPDGRYTLVECDRHNPRGTSQLDIYWLGLDGTGRNFRRLTHFSDIPGFRATNPVVSPDGRLIAFQESPSDSAPGTGDGIYLLDLAKADLTPPSD